VSKPVAAAVLIALTALFAFAFLGGCGSGADGARNGGAPGDLSADRREVMVDLQIRARGVADEAVLAAMAKVPRHLFVPPELVDVAYTDGPLPIGHEQTISQPYIVALMTELLRVNADSRVLEIGTGSGYQAAVLSELADSVFTIEIVEPLARTAAGRLDRLGYSNVVVRHGDGYRGWPERAPFDAVIVTAAPEHVPQPLIDQLAVGGRLVIPVGAMYQELLEIVKTEDGVVTREVIPVRFVPMTGEARERDGP